MKKLILILVLAIAFFPAINTPKTAFADECVYFIICTPEGEVNVRKHAKIKSKAIGGLEFGKEVLSDGKTRNGFVHAIDLAAEETSGWVSKGYLVKSKPVACNLIGYAVGLRRIAARKCVDGKIIKWLEPGSEVIIYAYSEEWCVTEYGFMRTECIEIPEQMGRD